MKQHILPKQMAEITFEQAKLMLGDKLNPRDFRYDSSDWTHFHHKKVTIGKMIEFLGDNISQIDFKHGEGYVSVWYLLSNIGGYDGRTTSSDICGILWDITKTKLDLINKKQTNV